MNRFVWTNPYLPQTLQVSVILGYFRAVMTFLFASFGPFIPFIGSSGGLKPLGLLVLAGGFLGAFGIANIRWWGYILALIVALFPFVFGIGYTLRNGYSIFQYLSAIFSGSYLISTIFEIAIVALLVHPMSVQFVKSHFEKTIP